MRGGGGGWGERECAPRVGVGSDVSCMRRGRARTAVPHTCAVSRETESKGGLGGAVGARLERRQRGRRERKHRESLRERERERDESDRQGECRDSVAADVKRVCMLR